jgi:hypothetical protein
MPSTYTSSLRFELQQTGENLNTWGVRLNTSLQRIDLAIAGYVSIAISGDHTLTVSNTSDDQARSAMLKFTGALASPSVITLPSVPKSYASIWNATDKILTFSTGAGAVVAVNPGDKLTNLFCDGSNVYEPGYNGLGFKDYIASLMLASTGELPAQPGNAGRFIKTDGANATWQIVLVGDIGDYVDDQRRRFGASQAFAIAAAAAL